MLDLPNDTQMRARIRQAKFIKRQPPVAPEAHAIIRQRKALKGQASVYDPQVWQSTGQWPTALCCPVTRL
jgi:hypothetical protein